MRREQYSHLTLLTMLAIVKAGAEAYTLEISELLREATGRPVSVDILRQMLHRLGKYGMVAHKPEGRRKLYPRPGSPRTHFRLTPAGRKVLKQHVVGWNMLAKGLKA